MRIWLSSSETTNIYFFNWRYDWFRLRWTFDITDWRNNVIEPEDY